MCWEPNGGDPKDEGCAADMSIGQLVRQYLKQNMRFDTCKVPSYDGGGKEVILMLEDEKICSFTIRMD